MPFAPGGSTDIIARVLGQKIFESWGQQVVIADQAGRRHRDRNDRRGAGRAGWLHAADDGEQHSWRAAGHPLGRTRNVSAQDAAALARDGAAVLDVRSQGEWDGGHVPGASHVPLGSLPRRMADLPPGRPLVLLCQGGGRSAIAASLLAAQGVQEVVNVPGGFSEWSAAGLPVERGPASSLADLVVGPVVRRGVKAGDRCVTNRMPREAASSRAWSTKSRRVGTGWKSNSGRRTRASRTPSGWPARAKELEEKEERLRRAIHEPTGPLLPQARPDAD